MIRRNTQDPGYWESLRITDEDLEHLGNVLVDKEVPLPLDELAAELIAFRSHKEESQITRELSKGSLYLPKNSYEVGETIVFPMLEYAAGTIAGVRQGHNPEYEDFRVIQVDFPEDRTREFAIELEDHPLNEVLETEEEELLSPQELYQEYGAYVRAALGARLESEFGFIRLAERWFLKDLLLEINEGQLNICEAVLDVAGGGPLSTEELIKELDLSKEIKPQLAIFSLNYALQEDERFDEVGPAGEVLWHLRRLEPDEVLHPPARLQPHTVEYDYRLLDETMLNLERELDDEWSDLVAPPKAEEPVTVSLIYPHRCSGTLPLSPRLSKVFPTGRTHRIRFLFRDMDSGEEMEGWVVRERRFVYGLKEWYQRHDIPVGAYIDIARADEPGVILVGRRARRTRREWVRVATIKDGRITFEMSRFPLSCEVDDRMVIATEDMEALEEVSARVEMERIPLKEVLAEIFPQLAKLSPQGTVHASTLYGAVNVAMRTPPGPILAALVSDGRYAPMGDNYWVSRSRDIGV